MPKLAAFLPALNDPDLPDLQHLATRHNLAVHVNPSARALGRPAIELRARRSRQPLLSTFRNAAEAIEWLNAGQAAEARQ